MEGPKIMKTVSPEKCPHCGKDILISHQTMIPYVTGVSTIMDSENAKKIILERLSEIKFSSEDAKNEVVAYLNSPATLLETSDIEPFIKQVAIDQTNNSKQNEA